MLVECNVPIFLILRNAASMRNRVSRMGNRRAMSVIRSDVVILMEWHNLVS